METRGILGRHMTGGQQTHTDNGQRTMRARHTITRKEAKQLPPHTDTHYY